MQIKKLVQELNKLILEGKLLEAFEKFYADDVVVQENNNRPRVGKETNRRFEQVFVASIGKFNSGEMRNSVVDEKTGVSMTEWFYDITFKNGKRRKMTQVAVQTWKNGKIIRERFYYDSK